jgi:hypothetical protein
VKVGRHSSKVDASNARAHARRWDITLTSTKMAHTSFIYRYLILQVIVVSLDIKYIEANVLVEI